MQISFLNNTCLQSTLSAFTQKAADFKACNRGIAALEFVMIFPLYITIFFAVTELGYYKTVDRRAQFAVDFAAEFMSRDDDNILTTEEIWVMEDLWQIVNVTSFFNTGGDAYANSRGKYARAFSSIGFDKLPAGCAPEECMYEPSVDWTFLAHQGVSSPKRRTCQQRLIENSGRLDETTLPKAVAGRSAIAVADFTYKYKPILDLGLINEMEKHVISIRKTRGGDTMDTSGSSGHYIRC